jgi:hypothetical protein
MGCLLSLLFLGAPVPNVVAGPALAGQARAVDLPIQAVTVFSDRAKINRGSTVSVDAGIQALRLPDLPGAALTDTVRMSAEGVTVVRLEVNPVMRERISIAELDALVTRIEGLEDELQGIDRQRGAYTTELALLGSLLPKAPPSEEGRLAGKSLAALVPVVWQSALGFIESRRVQDQAVVRVLATKARGTAEKLRDARQAAVRLNTGGLSDHKLEVIAILDATRTGSVRLSLDYFIAGASWLPIYDVRFAPDQGKVTLEAAGLVSQATGEAWNDVTMLLSTAIPGQGIDLPELLTWTLGERRELIPQSIARQLPPTAPRFTTPRPVPLAADATASARRELLTRKLATLVSDDGKKDKNTKKDVVRRPYSTVDFDDVTIEGELVRPDAAYLEARRAPPPGAPPPPVPMMMAPRSVMAVEESVASTGGRFQSAEQAPALVPMALGGDDTPRAPTFADPNLPAMVAGGFDYVYRAATRADVPSTAERARVPLRAMTFPVTTFYEATPAIMPVAFLKARVENREEQPVLRGRANIFVDGAFVSEGALETTGPGGRLELPLGADENIKLQRRVVPSTASEGVFSKKDVTTYEVVIELSSFKKTAVRVEVTDQVPKTRQSDIEIAYLGATPPQKDGPDADGIVHWEVSLSPGNTSKIVFKYQIKRPKDWQLTSGS